MHRREDIIKFLELFVNEIQKQIRGKVWCEEDNFGFRYIIRITDSDIKYSFDITNILYKIETENDADKLLLEIIRQYKNYIFEKYFLTEEEKERLEEYK